MVAGRGADRISLRLRGSNSKTRDIHGRARCCRLRGFRSIQLDLSPRDISVAPRGSRKKLIFINAVAPMNRRRR